MNNKFKTVIRKIRMAYIGFMASLLLPVVAYADGAPEIGQAITKFSTIFASMISAVGGVVMIWQIVNLALAIKRRDPAATSEALIGVGAGLLIVFAPQVVVYIMS